MQPITTPIAVLESIAFDVLTGVSGGCKRPAPAPVNNVQNVQNVQYVQAPPQLVPVPMCACGPRQPASVDTSVEIGNTSTISA